jgi:choline dehydrogenase-like flavoprotein
MKMGNDMRIAVIGAGGVGGYFGARLANSGSSVTFVARGPHNRLKTIDIKHWTVTPSILDGAQGGHQYYYHLVTDASASLPAVLEKGVFAPRSHDSQLRPLRADRRFGTSRLLA